MSLNQLIDNGITTPCLSWKKVKVYDLNACNSVNSPEGDFDNVDTTTINGLPYPPGGGFLPVPVANKVLVTDNSAVVSWGSVRPVNLTSGTTGQVIKTTAPSTVAWANVTAGDLTPGTARQLLQTNAGATAAEWTSNIDIPGTLDCTGNVVFDADLAVTNDLNVINGDLTVVNGGVDVTLGDLFVDNGDMEISTGDLRVVGDVAIGGNLSFNGVSGTVGQVLTKTGATTQSFQTLSVPPSVITPGSNNQVMITSGGSATWSDNVSLPGALTVNGTSNIAGNMQFAGVSGTSGQFVKKTGAATQAFSDIAPSDTKGGTLNQVMQSDGTSGVFNTNVTIPGTLTSTGTFTASNAANITGTLTTNGTANIVANMQFAGVSGTSGQFLKKTSGTTQSFQNIVAGDVTPGTANQLLVTNGAGTAATWTTDVSFPGNIAMIGAGTPIASLGETRVYYALKLGGNLAAAYAGQVCVSDASSIPHWEDPQYFAQYYQNAPLQDMNGAATVTLLTTALVNVSNSNITYSAGTFTIAQAGNYVIRFETRASTSAAQTQVNFYVNGAYSGSTTNIYVPALVQAQPLVLEREFRFSGTGNTLQVISEPLVAGTVNTSAADSRGAATTMLTIRRIGAYVP